MGSYPDMGFEGQVRWRVLGSCSELRAQASPLSRSRSAESRADTGRQHYIQLPIKKFLVIVNVIINIVTLIKYLANKVNHLILRLVC
ncbi:hypothetical protein K1T71_009696 [Dendrolimus kikuchii]|uniref:Uncharacterized protein n=1 Tax=Dendrolimus kikuchii TaxID=765133 RepID=A0ACC1CSJ4_9NEOP|nr:hypothetical protein K1T71_009696 [Dendrolimus kikuchii]